MQGVLERTVRLRPPSSLRCLAECTPPELASTPDLRMAEVYSCARMPEASFSEYG